MALKEIELVDTTPLVAEEEALLTLLPGAADKIRTLLSERNLPEHGLRLFVSGGGCSGMQYGMAIDKEAGEFDSTFESNGVKVFMDPTSMMYLSGATVDYVDNMMGGGFRIENPNAVSTCGCGHSFRTSGSAASSGDGDGCGHH